MNCKYPKCGKLLPPPSGRRVREYCNNAHKQAHYRLSHQVKPDQAPQGATFTEMLSELVALRERTHDLEQENMRLLNKLDVERRYHEDHEKRSFKVWLKKQPAAHQGEVGKRILADDYLPTMGSRALYAAHLRKNKYSPDEMSEFAHLWKLMLLQS